MRRTQAARGTAHADPLLAYTPVRACVYLSLMPRPRCCAQARDLGYASAAAATQLETAPLLQRLELASAKALSVRGTLAPRTGAASGAGGALHSTLGFASLPHAVALHILSFVPADARARTALVSRSWRVTVADAKLWTVLDLSPASGVAQPVSDATLRGAAALARGGLTALCLDVCRALTQEARLEVVTANAGSLRRLSCVSALPISSADAQELSDAAPQLVSFKVDVEASVTDAIGVLRNGAPYGALQLDFLGVGESSDYEEDDDDDNDDLADMQLLAFCSAVSAHTSLSELQMCNTRLNTPAVTNALSAAALACKLVSLELIDCDLSPASVPALARLVQGGVLETLHIINNGLQLLDEAAAVQLADAVAVSRTLTRLKLSKTCFWDDAAAAAVVMRALTGHPRLQEVELSFDNPRDQLAAGAALGALIAVNAPALQFLSVDFSRLGDNGMGPLFAALPHNNHLRVLHCYGPGVSEAFARDILLPAVRANASLRKLFASPWQIGSRGAQPPVQVREAEALVAARNTGDR